MSGDVPRTSAVTYSFVIPVHNEAGTLPELRARLTRVLGHLDGESEVIFVDDGSTDSSWGIMTRFHAEDPRFKSIRLSRNFGHQIAITAGMDLAGGQAVIVMDADLQDPPEVALQMAEQWRAGHEVVFGVREDRTTDTRFKRLTASAFYRILRRLTDVDIPEDVGDFRLIDRRAVEAFRSMREGSRFVRGMYAWVGFDQVGVPYRREARYAGETNYPLKKMLRLAGDGVIGFSRVPLRIALKLGALSAAAAILGALAVVGLKLLGDMAVPGWTSILVAVCLLGGLQLAVLGVLGQYIGRAYEESLGRPLYVVSHLHGVPTPIQPVPRAVIAEPPTVSAILGEPPSEPAIDLTDPAASGVTGSV